MAVEGQQPWMAEIIAAHLPGMKPEIKRTFLGLAAGVSRTAIVRLESVDESTVQRWIDTGTAEIASRLTTAHAARGELRGIWIGAHQPCCLADRPDHAGGAGNHEQKHA